MNASDVYVFNKVAKSLSFTAAAREVGSSRSAISKTVSRLEKSLGVTLLNRNTRKVSLTEAGQALLHTMQEVDAIIERAIDEVRSAELDPAGVVKVSIPSRLAKILLPSVASTFQENWPNVKLDARFEDGISDLIGGGFDLGILVSRRMQDSNLVSRRLGSTRRVLAASPDYLSRAGNPASPADLEDHKCLGLSNRYGPAESWALKSENSDFDTPCSFSISCDNEQALVDLACLGNGVIYVPQVHILDELAEGKLVELMPDAYVPESLGIFAVYPNRNAPSKVKVLVEFLHKTISELPSTTA